MENEWSNGRLTICLNRYIDFEMKLRSLRNLVSQHPATFPRFVLPDGNYVPAHANITEIGHVIRKFIDCGGETGKEEKVLLQTHVGSDTEHRLRSDRFARILELGERVLPGDQLDVEVEYDCCVVAQYPIAEARFEGQHLDLLLSRGRTQCRARGRQESSANEACCGTIAACC